MKLFLLCSLATFVLGLPPRQSLPFSFRNFRFLWLCCMTVWAISLLTR